MSYINTILTAKNSEHLEALRLILKTTFNNPVRIWHDDAMPENSIQVEALDGGQKKTLERLGYKAENIRGCGSFSS